MILVLIILSAPLLRAQDVAINEIMYHPASQSPRDEWIELHNRGATNVNLTGWRLRGGVDFDFPSNTILSAGAYLVVAGHQSTFQALHPGVPNVVGDFVVMRATNVAGYTITNWQNTLGNTRDEIELENGSGARIDRVEYADEGDWAQRQRSLNDGGYRGWVWFAEHDGLGKSLELRNSALPNEHGQNWTASVVVGGTPGQPNSVATTDLPPMILGVAHFPLVPRSIDSISVTARIVDELASGLSVQLAWRVDAGVPPPSQFTPMFDDGMHGDGLAGDGIYAATLPAQANNSIIEFYVSASDSGGATRTWPAPAMAAPDQPGPATQTVNALLQVDDNPANNYGANGVMQPVFKLIMTAAEASQLQSMPCNIPAGDANTTFNRSSDVQVNGAFVSLTGTGDEVRYQIGVKRRGHGSRCSNPRNYRVNFVSADPFDGLYALNLNSRQVHLQHLGATLANKSGAAGPYTRAVRLRVNNSDNAESGGQMFGSYAASEAYDSRWAERHFPANDGGNIYKVVRDIDPPNFNFRGNTFTSYTNTYFKDSNSAENDWTDLMAMLSVMGENSGTAFTVPNIRQVIDPEQWLTHLAVMNLLGNAESGLNTGNNDDYFLYRGIEDPRFILAFHDLDQILGQGNSFGTSSDIFRATGSPVSGDSEGTWRAMTRFMRSGEFEPIYYATLQRLLDTTFSKAQFDALVEQTLGGYATPATMNSIRTWMDSRRAYVQSVINGLVPPTVIPPVATIAGEPRNPSPTRDAALTVGGVGITHYQYRLNTGSFSAETPIASPITLSNLPLGSTNRVYVIGKSTNGAWQSISAPTVSKTWVVNTSTPTVRLNEVLASNNGALVHSATTPDAIELFNDGNATVDLSGLRLTDNKDEPGKFTFPNGTTLAAGAYLTVFANNADGTPGLHTGFSLDPDGDQVYLFDRAANGNVFLDVVKFGRQITDLSIGRVAGGTWALTQPTFGGANVPQALGNEATLKINEWLASGGAQPDFIELYNPDVLPVALGGLFLTDAPIGIPALHRIDELSFVPANGFALFTADGDSATPSHVGFQLSSAVGEIGLFSAILQPIDCVIYGPQQTGVSMGRCPDGGATNRLMSLNTPGAINACPVPPPGVQTVPLLPFEHFAKYDQSGVDLGTAWIAPGYNDSAWPTGQSFFGTATQGSGSWGTPVRTLLTAGAGRTTFYFRTTFTNNVSQPISALQVEHLIDDGAVFYLNGQEWFRYNMPAGQVTFSTTAPNLNPTFFVGPVNVPANLLVPGVNYLAVELHQSSTSTVDIGIGFRIDAVIVTNTAASAGVVINEVLASNSSFAEPDGSTPDWIEIYNPSQSTVDLADMSLTDSPATPRRWVFPSGSIVPAQGFLRVRFDSGKPASETNTGWGLGANGDSVYLYNTLASGGSLRDAITFGIQIPDFSIARLPNGGNAWNLALPTIGSGNIAATLGSATALKINEWRANPFSGDDDFVELFNPGAQPVALGGLWLTDRISERNKHQIAPLSFIGAASNAWTEFKADGNTALGAHHVSFSLSANGEEIGLSLPNLTLIDGVSFGAQTEGASEGLLPDGTGAIQNFATTVSPGSANFLLLNNIAINEVLTHSDPPLEDAIELRNLTGSAVDIGGWWLSDAKGTPRKYQIPAGTILPPNGFAVFYESQFNNPDLAIEAFSLSSAKGDEVYLSMTGGGGELAGYRAVAEFGPAANGVSMGRYVTSAGADFTAMAQRTFGVDNPATVEQFRTGTGLANSYPRVGPVVFTEIMYQPPLLGGLDNARDEFLEIRNISAGSVALYDPAFPTNRWRVRGGVDLDLPPGIILAPNASVVLVSFDPALDPAAASAFRSSYGLSGSATLVGPWSGKLANDGERIELQRPDTPQMPPSPDAGLVPYIAVDRVVYSPTLPWPQAANGSGWSIHRLSATGYANDPTNWFSGPPSPTPGGGVADTDNDGIPDAWENQFPLAMDPNDPTDANLDYDADGMTALQEYFAGTDPQNAASALKVSVSLTPSYAARLQFSAVSNVAYTLQHRTSLSTGAWINLQNIPAAGNNQTITLTNVPGSATRFYRVIVP